ncbi:MlaD family protein [Nocardia sp. NPDC052001]|uniref:MlaD family protein n=1 Tax=Nocardia sp. NPDC052001 TaxID=3154853 RepID=UPI00342D78C0
MLRRLFASRAVLSVATLTLVAVVAVGGYTLAKPPRAMRTYCAAMPDAIGLYAGSTVTLRGIASGKVTRIQATGTGARVDFDIPADEALPPDVGATTVSDTLVADRRLALIGNRPTGGPHWDAGRCITKTLTPKSLSQTFSAVSKLADELNGGADPAQQGRIGAGLAAVNDATAGTGPQINDIIRTLSTVLDSPDAAIGHLGRLLDALAALAHSAANGWGEVEEVLTGLPGGLHAVDTMAVPPITSVLTDIGDVLPMLNDITVMFGGEALRQLDAADPLILRAAAGLGSLLDVIRMIPSLAGVFTRSVDADTGRTTLDYAPPRVQLPTAAAEQVCAAVNALTPGRCADDGNGLVNVPLTALIFGSVGAR